MDAKEKLRILNEQRKKEEERRRELEVLIEEVKNESEEEDREERGEKGEKKKDEKEKTDKTLKEKEESIEDKVKDVKTSGEELKTYDFKKDEKSEKDPYRGNQTQEQTYSSNFSSNKTEDYQIKKTPEENSNKYSGTRDSLTFEKEQNYTF